MVVPSSASTVATGVNNAGLITGYYVDNTSNAGTHGFTGTTGGGYTPFDNPNAISGNTWGSASNGTTTVGYFNDINGQHGFAGSSPFATATTLDYPSAAYTQAFGINNSGTVVGEYGDASGNIYGFAESGGNYTQISDPNGLYDTYATTVATGIDARGDIVGYYTDGGGATHGFIDVVGVGFITIDAPNSTQTEVLGVND